MEEDVWRMVDARWGRDEAACRQGTVRSHAQVTHGTAGDEVDTTSRENRSQQQHTCHFARPTKTVAEHVPPLDSRLAVLFVAADGDGMEWLRGRNLTKPRHPPSPTTAPTDVVHTAHGGDSRGHGRAAGPGTGCGKGHGSVVGMWRSRGGSDVDAGVGDEVATDSGNDGDDEPVGTRGDLRRRLSLLRRRAMRATCVAEIAGGRGRQRRRRVPKPMIRIGEATKPGRLLARWSTGRLSFAALSSLVSGTSTCRRQSSSAMRATMTSSPSPWTRSVRRRGARSADIY